MFKARPAQRGRGAIIPLFGLSLAAIIAGFSFALAQDSAGRQAYLSPVVGQPARNCEFVGSQPGIVDADQWARLILNYERYCYKQAEIVIRRRLQLLAAVRRSPPTGNSARQQSLAILKSFARAIETDAPPDIGSVADAAPVPSFAPPPATGNGPLSDAKFYLELGIASYRDGDLPAAIADFDLAIQFDPSLPDAYINQGIVWYRVGSFNRAFDDIAQAVRIENSH